MPERERVLARENGTIWAQQILADKAHQTAGDVIVVVPHHLDGAAMKGLSLD